MERSRQTHSKELDGKDEEVEEIRLSCSKKVNKDVNVPHCARLSQFPTSLFDHDSFEMCVCVQLKQMEVQLEEEYDDKQRVLREKRELESKLMAAQEQVPTQCNALHSAQNSTQPNIQRSVHSTKYNTLHIIHHIVA